MHKKIRFFLKAFVFNELVELLLIVTCISGTCYLQRTEDVWLSSPTYFISASLGLFGLLQFAVISLLTELFEETSIIKAGFQCIAFVPPNILAIILENRIHRRILQSHHLLATGLILVQIAWHIISKYIKRERKVPFKLSIVIN